MSLGTSKHLPKGYSKPLPGNGPTDIKKKHHTYRNGDKFKGTYVDGIRNGERGVYAWKTFGGDYDGAWKDGKHHGRGKYVWPDGDSYEGDFHEDKIHGRGLFISVVLGEEFDGTFKKNTDTGDEISDPMLGSLRNGDGYCVYNSPHECEGYSYRGNWKNSYWDGNGILTRDIPGGLGEKKFMMIERYEGDFCDGKISGQGVADYRGGENHPWKQYRGAWLSNQWHGDGTLKFLNGNEFVGSLVQSKLDFGSLYYSNGDEYRGRFVDGLRHDSSAFFKFANHTTLLRLENANFVEDSAIWVNKAYYKNEDEYVGPWDHEQNVPHGSNGRKDYKAEDKVYEGDFVYGDRQGVGKCDYFANNSMAGECYTGQWDKDTWHGYGTLTFGYGTGDMYVGQFNYGKKEGRGTFTYKSNDNFDCPVQLISFAQKDGSFFAEYTGDWKDDKRNGAGKCIFGSSETYYDGAWSENNVEGYGLFECDEYKYTGDWSQNEFHGQGNLFLYKSGDEYSGSFDHGVIHGKGTYTYKTAQLFSGVYEDLNQSASDYYAMYTGDFDYGVRHGKGVMYYGSSNVFYDGDWDQGIRNGTGKLSCPDFEYTGDWVNDLKEGRGFITCDIHDYDGDWKNDLIQGRGKLTLHQSGESYVGDFDKDKPHGFGKIYYREGDLKFDGKFHAGKRVYGVFHWRENAVQEYGGQWYRVMYDGEWTDVQELDWGDNFPDGKGKMVWKNGEGHTRTYDGEWKDGKCHGKGKLVISRGQLCCDETYEGPFADGVFHGPEGHYSFPSKADPQKADQYVGEFANGKKHGKGSMYRAEDKSRHEGDFDNDFEKPRGVWHLEVGKLEGFYKEFDQETGRRGLGVATKLTYVNYDTYVGEVNGNVKHGEGELVLKAKKGFTFRSYKGYFANDKFDGEGQLVFREYMDEKEYKGSFKSGRRHGYGTIYYKNGDVYVGEIYEDMRQGKGKLTFGRGGWVDGQWRKDLLDGDVVYSHRDGFLYEGPYVEQRKDGSNAVCKFADGSVYEGEVKRGKIHGTGKLVYPDNKKVYEGEFKDGKQHGRGKFTDTDGSTYEGQFVDGLMQGRGKMTYPNKTVYEGDWKDGFKHGDGEFRSPGNEVLEKGRYHNGIYLSNSCCPAPVQPFFDVSKFKMWYNKWSSIDPKIIEAKKNSKSKPKGRNSKSAMDLTNQAAASGKAASSAKTDVETPRMATARAPTTVTVGGESQ